MNSLIKFYHWSGIRHGRKTKGVTVDTTPENLKIKLRRQHVHVLSVKQRSGLALLQQHARLTNKQLLQFTQQLTTAIKANIPLLEALDMLESQQHCISVQTLLIKIKHAIQNGASLADAMKSSHPLLQGNYADLIEIGEMSGKLPECLDKLCSLLERQQHIKAKVIKASIYPGFVLFTSVLVTYLMLTQVVPEFGKIYSSMNAELPAVTQTLVHLSQLIQSYGSSVVLITLMLTVLGRIAYRRHSRFHFLIQTLLLNIPLIGTVMFKSDVARTMQTLFTCYSSGIPIMECLHMTQKSVSTDKFKQVINQIRQDMETGQTLYFAISKQQHFPMDVEQMITMGENSGTLSTVFEKLAGDYTEQVNNVVDNLGTIIEPVIVLFIGSLVGGIVIAMYLPIFNLMSMLG